jgi:regulator of replication initiation timing
MKLMNEIMNWVTHYNALIIQIGFTIVLLLIIVYVYRIFFSASRNQSDSDSIGGSAELTEVNKKLNQLLQQQPLKSQKNEATDSSSSVSSASDVTGSSSSSNAALSEEVDRLKSEVFKLREQLNESEKKVFELTPTETAAATKTTSTEEAFGVSGAAAAGAADNSAAKITELNAKIEQLQARLSEYDIIADDIAELSQLRAENAELKKMASGSPTLEAPAVELVEPVTAETEVKHENLNAIFEEAAEDEVVISDPSVPEAEKDLMNDFEKSTEKG